MGRIAPRFSRVEPRRRVRSFLLGLLAGLPRTNCWTIAEQAGQATPDGLQHLLARAVWDADAVRDDLRDYVVEHLADPQAVLVVDETGDVKKGTATVGVQRQYTGTAGRIENAQVAVYLVYAAAGGHAFIDRALYLPKAWTEDRARLAAAGVPDDVGFATKPALARTMIGRADRRADRVPRDRRHLPLGQVRPPSRLLETERKLLTHAIRMSAYNAESALARLLRPHYSRGDDEARALLREAFTLPGDLQIIGSTLHVRLDPASAPRRSRAIHALCTELTDTNTHYPGTDLTIAYSVKNHH